MHFVRVGSKHGSRKSLNTFRVLPDKASLPSVISAGRVIWAFVAVGLCLLSGLLIVPFSPWMPAPGLDAAWGYGLNEAIVRHLVFGKDIIFTFGPFAPVYTQLYSPGTDSIMVYGGTAIALGFCSAAVVLASSRHRWLLIILPLCIASTYLKDSIFLALPFLLLLSVSVVYGSDNRKPAVGQEAALLLVFASTALLPLVKGSFAGEAWAELGLSFVLLIVYGQRFVALKAVSTAALSLVAGWWATGQPLLALPTFFIAQSQFISGYTEAMSSHGPFVAVLYFWIAAILMLMVQHFGRVDRGGVQGAVLTLGLVLALFIAFKSGFVRQDVHPRIAADAFLLLGFGVASVVRLRAALLVLVIAIVAFFMIENTTGDFGIDDAYKRITNAVCATVAGVGLRVSDPAALPAQFASAKEQIKKSVPLPVTQGRSDVYPSELSILFAHDIDWDPRPIIQSYSAYTPGLSQRNADHLLGPDAPDNVFLSVDPIDGRIPTLEDAYSWPLLLSRYAVHENLGDRLWLTLTPLSSGTLVLGRQEEANMPFEGRVPVPFTGPVWASVDIRPNLFGRLALLLFKLPIITAELSFSDGSVIYRRLVPEMARGGFILSPYIGSTADFIEVASGVYGHRSVRSIRVLAPTTLFWRQRIDVVFHELQLPVQKLNSLPTQ
jgi:hypothetical protein